MLGLLFTVTRGKAIGLPCRNCDVRPGHPIINGLCAICYELGAKGLDCAQPDSALPEDLTDPNIWGAAVMALAYIEDEIERDAAMRNLERRLNKQLDERASFTDAEVAALLELDAPLTHEEAERLRHEM